jgi:serine/threonine-protein kinase
MGVVFEAHHLALDERVAIKVLRDEIAANEEANERFLREARAATKVKSEHIARILDFGSHDDVLYMVMEYLEGEPLSRVLEGGPLPIATAIDYVLQACAALEVAHAAGIVHRDLKPDNLFLATGADGVPRIKLLDFGISKMGGLPLTTTTTGFDVDNTDDAQLTPLTSTAAVIGSPHYMSPEQLLAPRSVDRRSDVWGLGVVLFELLTGKHVFSAESLPHLCVLIREAPARSVRALRPEVGEHLEAIVHRCLAKDPASRFQSAAALASALRVPAAVTKAEDAVPLQSAEFVATPTTLEVDRIIATRAAPKGPHERSRLWLAVVALAVAGVGGYAISSFTSGSQHVAPDAPRAPATMASSAAPAAAPASVSVSAIESPAGPPRPPVSHAARSHPPPPARPRLAASAQSAASTPRAAASLPALPDDR